MKDSSNPLWRLIARVWDLLEQRRRNKRAAQLERDHAAFVKLYNKLYRHA
jgi:hypothetical protein